MRIRVLPVIILTLALAPLAAQPIDRLEFVDAPVPAILMGLGRAAGAAIIVDRDVTGTASYFFEQTSFPEALYEFAEAMGLFVETDAGIYRISPVLVRHEADDLLTIEAPNARAASLLNRIAAVSATPIVHNVDHGVRVSYFGRGVPAREALARIADQLPGYALRPDAGALVVAAVTQEARWQPGTVEVLSDGDGFSLVAQGAALGPVLAELFAEGRRACHLLADADRHLPDLRYEDLPFDRLLTLVLDHAGARFERLDGVYVVVPTDPGVALARTLTTRRFWPEEVAAAELVDLLPPEQLAGVSVRPDRTGESLTITGSRAGVERVRALLASLDVPHPGRASVHLHLQWRQPEDVLAALPDSFRSLDLTLLPNALAASGPARLVAEFRDWVRTADTPTPLHVVRLDHMEADDLLSHLPPGVAATEIHTTSDPRVLQFTGSEARLELLRRHLALVDRPVPVIHYQVLVIEYSRGTTLDWKASAENAVMTPESRQAFLAGLGGVLSLKFDVLSALGYDFALRLNAALARSAATVVADVVLVGDSGAAVEFRNTETYRYRDPVLDPQTGEAEVVGVTRELVSGLLVGITGTAGPDDISVEVTATLSRRGTDTGTANPPPTSERLVQTRVRVAPGEPIVLSGLATRSRTQSRDDTPLLSRIPLLGALFSNITNRRESGDLAIYLIPSITSGPAWVAPASSELIERHLPDWGTR